MFFGVRMGPGHSSVCGNAGASLHTSPGQKEAVTGADKLLNSSVISNGSFTVCAFVKVDRGFMYSTLLTITEKYRRVSVGKYEFHSFLLLDRGIINLKKKFSTLVNHLPSVYYFRNTLRLIL